MLNMNTQKTKKLRLVVDNTVSGKIKDILIRQEKLIKAKIQLQKDREIINEYLKKYENEIILLENKIEKIQGRNKC